MVWQYPEINIYFSYAAKQYISIQLTTSGWSDKEQKHSSNEIYGHKFQFLLYNSTTVY